MDKPAEGDVRHACYQMDAIYHVYIDTLYTETTVDSGLFCITAFRVNMFIQQRRNMRNVGSCHKKIKTFAILLSNQTTALTLEAPSTNVTHFFLNPFTV